MRIISGIHKGRKILPPKGLPVRPTTDLCKESLFNILQNNFHFNELKVLDLFAGTGNISFEFASRGVISVTSIEQDLKCVNYIKQISEQLDMPTQVIKSDVFRFLEKNKAKFNVIFADPPYDLSLENFEKIIQLIFENQMLEEGGSLIIEHSKHTDLSQTPHFVEIRTYGGSVFSFFEH